MQTGTGSNVITGTTYGPAGELKTLNGVINETRSYNSRLQLTGVNGVTYTYPTGLAGNNGRIQKQTNSVTGEEITYQYDELNRLISAVTSDNPNVSQWGQSFSYDGFGNLTGKTVTKGSAPSLSVAVDAGTNRILGGGYSYDANGNTLYGSFYGYDYENRLVGSQGSTYGYDADNRKVYSTDPAAPGEMVYFFGAGGQQMGAYRLYSDAGDPGHGVAASLVLVLVIDREYFGGRLIGQNGIWTAPDRLGSVGSYYPYGEAKGAGGGMFATYTRESGSGLDYAVNRWYSSGTGRFMTADPYMASGGPADPGSWNRYAYVGGDPVNWHDQDGLQAANCNHQGNPSDPDTCAPPDEPGRWQYYYAGNFFVGESWLTRYVAMYVPGTSSGAGGSRAPAPCDSKILDPKYLKLFSEMGKNLGIDPMFIMALALQESGWNLVHVYETNGSSKGKPLNNLFGSTYGGGNNIAYPSVEASARAWETTWGSYLVNSPTTIQAFVNALTSDPNHLYNANPDWKVNITGGTLKDGTPTSGTFDTLKREFAACNIAFP